MHKRHSRICINLVYRKYRGTPNCSLSLLTAGLCFGVLGATSSPVVITPPKMTTTPAVVIAGGYALFAPPPVITHPVITFSSQKCHDRGWCGIPCHLRHVVCLIVSPSLLDGWMCQISIQISISIIYMRYTTSGMCMGFPTALV